MHYRNNGTGRAQGSDLLDQMCTLNESFRPFGLQFYIKDGVNIVDNGAVYDSPTILNVQTQMVNLSDNEALNIFVIGNAQNPQSARPGNTLGFYDPQRDWIVIEEREIRNGGMTLPHELGHFFSLPHPFNGWDSDPYSASKHGSPAPEQSPGGATTEFADGSNCETAGDRICDTPADYLYFSQLNNTTCTYNEVMIDPKGDTLQPDPTLIMGYFLDRCMNRFTPMQAALMLTDYESQERAYLKNPDFSPVETPIADEPIADTAISPADESTVASFGEVTLEWDAVEGATSYFLESNIDGFEAVSINESSLVVPVEIGRTYFWKVKPFNDSYFCTPFSSLWKFTVEMASSVPSISGVDKWTVQPNPVNSTADLQIAITANEAFEASLQLRNIAGSIVRQISTQTFFTGTNKVQISSKGLEAGLYILSLENEEGVNQRKVIVY